MTVQQLLQSILIVTAIGTLNAESSEVCTELKTFRGQYIIQCSGLNSNNMDLLRNALITPKLRHPRYELLIEICDSVGTDLPVDIFNGSNVRTMVMTNCNFTEVPYDLLSYLPISVVHLDLSNNHISDISFTRLNELPFARRVINLYLQSNRIAYLPEDAFANFTELIILNLQGNLLTEIPDNAFRGLTKLNTLYLNENHIANVGTDAFATLDHLRLLVLDVNNIEVLNNGTFSTDEQKKLHEIPLEGNPFYCDCSLQWLKDYLIAINYLGASGATCAYPNHLPFDLVDFCATDDQPDEGQLRNLKLK